ncbi:collagen binding domain-containing protein [Anaerocolumna aminovalerica]|uniref:collagen binding domain-containing protein n=1 Tax=Anaerocolumna aminovalerica TaxID=1527 RepID=UPI00248ABBEC|nr:collagen binding domain-containing protein [Anaerocolumna aminovalerica]
MAVNLLDDHKVHYVPELYYIELNRWRGERMLKQIKNRQFKSKLTFILIIAILIQTIFPFFGNNTYAAEKGEEGNNTYAAENGEEAQNETISEVSAVSGSAIATTGAAITGYINKIEIKDENEKDFVGEVKANSKILLKYYYAIPDEEIVDTTKVYTLTIPSEINILKDETILLKDGKIDTDGDGIPDADRVVATVRVYKDNTITYQFEDEINNIDKLFDRYGFFYIYSEFDEVTIGTGGPKEIVFDLGGGATTNIYVDFEKVDETANIKLVKSGSYDINKNEITWKIVITPESTPYRKPISNVVIKDIIQDGQTYIEGSASLSPKVEEGILSWDETNKELSYHFVRDINTTDNEVYTLTFKTKVDTDLFDKEGKQVFFKNQAASTFEGDRTSLSNEATVNTTVDFVNKNGIYESGTKRIKWTVTINRNNVLIPDAVIIDTIPKGLTLETNSVKINGEAKTLGTDFTYVNNQLRYEFKEAIQKAQILEYYTTVTDETIYDSNAGKTFTNNVEFTGTGVPGDAKEGKGVYVGSNVISKQGNGYNRTNHTITWKITVNSNKISIKNGVVTDNIPVGLKYVDGSFKITLNNTEVKDGIFEYKEADSTDTKKTGTFTYTFADTINETYVIEFKTKVTDNKVYAVNGSKDFKNTANLKGENANTGKTINSSADATQQVSSRVIEKTGTDYDYLKREITWKIVVNQNKMSMKNAYVTDIIGEKQEFVPESVTIEGKKAQKGSQPNEKNSYYYDEATKTLRYNFPEEITTEQIITFKTKIVDLTIFDINSDKTLQNTAKLFGDDIPSNVESTGTRTIKNTVVSKKGIYSTGNSYIDWEVDINQNKVPIKDAVLEDTLQTGLELDSSSVKLLRLNTKATDGSLSESEDVTAQLLSVKYDISTGKVTFAFKGEIDSAYRLKFRTDIDEAYKNGTFSNSITFKGSGISQNGTSNSIGVSFQNVGGGAGGTGRGSITITKVDENNTATKLKGAAFELLDMYQNVLKTSEETGEDGKVMFDKLKLNTIYYIREAASPTGYNLSTELYEFKLTDENKNITYEFKNSIITGNIIFHKLNEDNLPLPGAEFTLYHENDVNLENPLSTAISDEQGKVEFKNVPYGSYKIIETKAPEGYLISGEVLTATILENLVIVTTVPASISNTKIKGQLKIMKVDKTTLKPLANAKISVYNESDVLIAEKETDENGIAVFENISYGKYYFIESKAPSGYVRNTEKHPFTISQNGEVIQVTFENVKSEPNNPGGPEDNEEPNKPEENKPEENKPEENKPEENKPPKENKPKENKPKENKPKEEKQKEPKGGKKTGSKKTEEEFEIDPNGIPLGGKEGENGSNGSGNKDGTEKLPKTGENSRIGFYIIGAGMIFTGFALKGRRKHRE